LRRFLDTNVLLYSISEQPSEQIKRNIAEQLLAERDGALSVQVLQEFYAQATRPTRPRALTHDDAVRLIRTWLRFPIQDMTVAVMGSALDIKARTGFSYWDAAIIAAARALDCDELLTEDLTHGRKIDGMRIVNPFR